MPHRSEGRAPRAATVGERGSCLVGERSAHRWSPGGAHVGSVSGHALAWLAGPGSEAGRAATALTMRLEGYRVTLEHQAVHWWYRSRRELWLRQVRPRRARARVSGAPARRCSTTAAPPASICLRWLGSAPRTARTSSTPVRSPPWPVAANRRGTGRFRSIGCRPTCPRCAAAFTSSPASTCSSTWTTTSRGCARSPRCWRPAARSS